MANISWEIQRTEDGKEIDRVIEERGNTMIMLRTTSWNGRPAKTEVRKWTINGDGEERAGGGCGLSPQGCDSLTTALIEEGYGKTDEILEALKPREDLASSINKVLGNIPGIEIDPSEYKDEDYFDPNQLFGGSEDNEQ